MLITSRLFVRLHDDIVDQQKNELGRQADAQRDAWSIRGLEFVAAAAALLCFRTCLEQRKMFFLQKLKAVGFTQLDPENGRARPAVFMR